MVETVPILVSSASKTLYILGTDITEEKKNFFIPQNKHLHCWNDPDSSLPSDDQF